MTRVRDWRKRLSDTIEARRRMPFSDQNNCAEFVAQALTAMGGPDILASVRGKYRTIPEGLVLLRQQGHDGLCGLLASFFAEIPPALATAGDIACVADDAIGIVNGERVTVMSEQGLGTVARTDMKRAFRVPA